MRPAWYRCYARGLPTVGKYYPIGQRPTLDLFLRLLGLSSDSGMLSSRPSNTAQANQQQEFDSMPMNYSIILTVFSSIPQYPTVFLEAVLDQNS